MPHFRIIEREANNAIAFLLRSRRRWAFFFFVGGLQPKKVQIDDTPRPCPTCGLPSARLKRLDHYISLFFIPLIPVKRGEEILECSRCGGVFDPAGRPQSRPFQQAPFRSCPWCGQELEASFKFCPSCGQRAA